MSFASLRQITAPAALPLSLAELRAQCRLSEDETDENALLMAYVRAAIGLYDGPDGELGRALITQTLELKVDGFPSEPGLIRLPCPPVQSVTEITYIDANGNEQTLSTSVYQVTGINSPLPGKITLRPDQTWPLTRRQPEAVTVTYKAGYGDDHNAVPETIRLALTMLVAYHFNQRETALVDPQIVEVPFGTRELLRPYKVHAF